MSRLRTFRVIFSDTRHVRIVLRARSAEAAIRTAERLYIDGDDDSRFVDFDGDVFQDAYAEEVEP